MATVTGLTAERMLEIEAASVVSGEINEDGDLILTTHDGTLINAGNAKGEPGDDATVPEATDEISGKTRYATNSETIDGSIDDAAVTPHSLNSRTATESRSGLIERSSQTEAKGLSDNSRAQTPLRTLDSMNAFVGARQIVPTSTDLSSGSATVSDSGTVSFSGTTFVEIRGVFTSAFRAYRVIYSIDTTTQIGIHGVLLTNTTPLRTGYDRVASGSAGSSTQLNDTEWICDGGGSGHNHFGYLDLVDVAQSGVSPQMSGLFTTRRSTTNLFITNRGGLQRSTTARNGFRFEGTAAGNLSGWVKVIAYI